MNDTVIKTGGKVIDSDSPNASFSNLTIRDYFAAQYISGIRSGDPYIDQGDIDAIAKNAYRFAAALLVEREKK